MSAARTLVLEAGIVFGVFFAPLAFGAVYPWGVLALSALFFLLFCLNSDTLLQFPSLPGYFRFSILLVLAWVLVQTQFFSVSPQQSRLELLQWLSFAALFMLCLKLPRTAVIWIFFFIVLAGTLESVYGLYEVLSGKEMILWHSKEYHRGFVTGTYINRNNYAGFMEMALGVHGGLMLRAFHKKQGSFGAVLLLLLGVSMFGLIKSGSRVGLMGFLLSIGFHSLFLWKKNVKGWFALLFILLACLGAGAALGWSTLSARFLEFGASLKTLDGRLIAWHDMIPMLRRYALTGTGLGNFQWVFPAYQSDRLLYGWQHAHNDYLELAAELGVPAAAVLITSFLSLWGASLSQADRKDFSSFVLVLGGLAGAGSVALHGFSDFNFAIPANAMTFVLILGLVTRLLQFNRQKILIKKNYD